MNSLIRQFALVALALAQCCSVYAAEAPEQALVAGANASGQKSVMVLFTPVEATAAMSGARLTNYRNRTGYYTRGKDRRLAEAVGRDYQLDLVVDWPITELDLVCAVLHIPDDRSIEDVMALLERDGRLQVVQKMQSFAVLANSDPYYPLQAKQYSMDLEKLHQVVTGRKISIAVIDTGVDLQHVDLAGQFALSKNFAEEYSVDFGGDRHGTAIAGIIAAKNHNNAGMVGIAPGARLLALKACWPDTPGDMASTCNTLTLALALNKAMMEEVSIINMSLAGPEDRIIALLLKRAIDRGILVVAADAVAPAADRFPASLAGVLAVSAMSAAANGEMNAEKSAERSGERNAERSGERNDEAKAPVARQQQAAEPDVLLAAPGINVLATAPSNSYDFFSGNSFAAAHVSGLAALLIQQCGKRDRDSLARDLQVISRHLQAGDRVESLSCYVPTQWR